MNVSKETSYQGLDARFFQESDMGDERKLTKTAIINLPNILE